MQLEIKPNIQKIYKQSTLAHRLAVECPSMDPQISADGGPPLLFPRLQVIHPGQVGSEPQWQHENDTAFNKRSVKKRVSTSQSLRTRVSGRVGVAEDGYGTKQTKLLEAK